MYASDHGLPHFHAHYQGFISSWLIEDLVIVAGELPPRIEKLVKQWASKNQADLLENFKRCLNHERPKRINPL